jgi:hypothetical protein
MKPKAEPGLSSRLTGAACPAIVFNRAEMNRHHRVTRDHMSDLRRYPMIGPGRHRLSSFRIYLPRTAAGYLSAPGLNQETFLLYGEGDEMKIHRGVKPAVWGAVVGAVTFAVVGFSSLGWDTRQHCRENG